MASSAPSGHVSNAKYKAYIPPKAFTYRQDVESIPMLAHFYEPVDNAVGANSREISLGITEMEPDGVTPTKLCIKDRGVGMTTKVATHFLQMAATTSGVVAVDRDQGRPLWIEEYLKGKMSRHGKGATSLLFFGPSITIYTKAAGTMEVTCISADYDEWQRREREGAHDEKPYEVDVEVLPCKEDQLAEGFTEIEVARLYPEVKAALANAISRKKMAQEMMQTYYFLIHGFDPWLWSSLPITIRGLQPAQRPVSMTGGLKIDFFGHKLFGGARLEARPGSAPRVKIKAPPPSPAVAGPSKNPATPGGTGASGSSRAGRDAAGAGAAAADCGVGEVPLQRFLRRAHELGVKPLSLLLRWTPDGMRPEDPQPTAEQIGTIKGRPRNTNEPAGLLQEVQKDFHMVFFFYPFKAMQRTKPDIRDDSGAEHETFIFWGGRLVTVGRFPAFVSVAQKDPDSVGEYAKLKVEKLFCLMFASPEVYTLNHKTHFQDEAFDDVMALGSQESSVAPVLDAGRKGKVWAWDDSAKKWEPGFKAVQMLKDHHKTHWRKQDESCSICSYSVDLEGDGLPPRGLACKTPLCDDPIESGHLVRLVDVARETPDGGGDGAGAAAGLPGTPGGAKARKGAKVETVRLLGKAADYRVVVYFDQHGADGNADIWVYAKRWLPPWIKQPKGPDESAWFTAGRIEALRIQSIAPLGQKKAEVKDAMEARALYWEGQWPRRLAFFDKNGTTPHMDPARVGYFQPSGVYSAQCPFPEEVVVGFISVTGTAVDINAHCKTMDKGILARLYKCGRQIPEYVEQVNYSQNKKAKFTGIQEQVVKHGEGSYSLHISCADREFIAEDSNLVLQFQVESSSPDCLHARFDQPGGAKVAIARRLGEKLPDLFLQLKDSSGAITPLGFVSTAAAKAALCVKFLQLGSDADVAAARRSGGAGGPSSMGVPEERMLEGGFVGDVVAEAEKAAAQRSSGGGGKGAKGQGQASRKVPDPVVELSSDKKTLVIKGLVIPAQELVVSGELAGRVDAALEVSLTLPNVKVVKPPPGQALRLSLLSGRPRIVQLAVAGVEKGSAEGSCAEKAIKVVPGEWIREFVAGLQDLSRNPFMEANQQQRVEAEVTFDPPDAVEDAQTRTRASKGLTSSSGPNPKGLFFTSGDVTVSNWFKVKGKPGQHFTMTVSAKAADEPRPGQASSSTGAPQVRRASATICFRVQLMHMAFDPRVTPMLPDKYAGCFLGGEKKVDSYVLNTYEHVERGKRYDAEGIPRLLAAAFEEREDVVRGQLTACYLRPNGTALRAPPHGKTSRHLLADAVNEHTSHRQCVNDVYEVAFAVDPTVKALTNLAIQICDEEDQHEPDFMAPVVLLRDGQEIEQLGELWVNQGCLKISSLPLNPTWFTRGNGECVMFDLRDACYRDFSFGSFWVRRRRALARLAPLPAGRLFEGVQVVAPPAPGAAPAPLQLLSQSQPPQQRGPPPAWAQWRLGGAAGGAASGRAAGGGSDRKAHLHPHTTQLQQHSPLRVRLGEPAVLHFVALDQAGFPIALLPEHQAALRGLQRLPVLRPVPPEARADAALAGTPQQPKRVTRSAAPPSASPEGAPQPQQQAPAGPQDQQREGAGSSGRRSEGPRNGPGGAGAEDDGVMYEDDNMGVEILEWQFAPAPQASGPQQDCPPLVPGHLPGPFVNSVALRVRGGTGRCEARLFLPQAGPCHDYDEDGRPLLPQEDAFVGQIALPLLVLPGRLGEDAVCVERAIDEEGREVELRPAPYQLDAATMQVAVAVKPDPGAAGEERQLEQRQQQQEGGLDGVIDLTFSDDEEMPDAGSALPPAQPPAEPPRLKVLEATVPERGALKLEITLRDEFGNEATEQQTGRLRLVRRRRPAAARQQGGAEGNGALGEEETHDEIDAVAVACGAATLQWQLQGCGPGWLGRHLLLVEAASSNDDLAVARPVAIVVNVVAGNIASKIVPLSPWAKQLLRVAPAGGTAAAAATAPVLCLDAPRAGAVQLPPLQVGLATRDGMPLRRPPATRLEARLMRWESGAPCRQQPGRQQQQQQPADGHWAAVPEGTKVVSAIRSFGGYRASAGGGRLGHDGTPGVSQGAQGSGPQDQGQQELPPVYELGSHSSLSVPPRPGLYKWVLFCESLGLPDVELGPVRVVAGPPSQLLAAAPGTTEVAAEEPPRSFIPRDDLAKRSFPGASLFLADAYGNPARFEPVQPSLLLTADGGADDEEGGSGGGDGSAARPSKRSRRNQDGGGRGGKDTEAEGALRGGSWCVVLVLEHRTVHVVGPTSRARRSSASPAAQQLARVLSRHPMDASGRCDIMGFPLAQLRLQNSAGEFAVVARAERVEQQQRHEQQQEQQQGVAQPELTLARYQVASADSASLLQQLEGVRSQRSALRRQARDCKVQFEEAQAKAQEMVASATEKHDEASKLKEQLERLRHQLTARHNMLEHCSQERLQNSTILLRPNQRNEPPGGYLPRGLVQAHASGAVLGRVICLGAVERLDVNRVICSILRASLHRIACATKAGAAVAREHAGMVGRWDLSNPDMADAFTALPDHQDHIQHPLQAPLDLQRLCADGVLNLTQYVPDEGFVGMAVNLIHMTPEQLAVRVTVQAREHPPGHLVPQAGAAIPLGLRKSLWWYLLGKTLIFERSEHMTRFRDRVAARGRRVPRWLKLYSLDGDSYNKMQGLEEATTQQYQGPLFSGVPADTSRPYALDLRLMAASLMANQARALEDQLGLINSEVQARQKEAKAALEEALGLEKLEADVARRREEQEPGLQEEADRLARELEQLGAQLPPEPGVDGEEGGQQEGGAGQSGGPRAAAAAGGRVEGGAAVDGGWAEGAGNLHGGGASIGGTDFPSRDPRLTRRTAQ